MSAPSGPPCPICPSCNKVTARDGEARPFCSPRCRSIDLGGWLEGRYRIAGEQHLDETSDEGAVAALPDGDSSDH